MTCEKFFMIFMTSHDRWYSIERIDMDRRFPPFQRAAQLWLNRFLPRGGEKKKRPQTIALQTACSTFCFFFSRLMTINCFSKILRSCSHLFRHVSVSMFHPSKMASNWKFLAEAMLQRPRKSKVSVFCLRDGRWTDMEWRGETWRKWRKEKSCVVDS